MVNGKAVQDERGPRKRKTVTIRRIEYISTPKTIDGFYLEILTQILIGCIQQTKENDGFRILSEQQQKMILSKVWCECFILRASHWSIDISSVIEKCNDSALKTLIDEIRVLNADLIELSLLETLILCRKGLRSFHLITIIYIQNTENLIVFIEYALSSIDKKQIDHLANGTLSTLARYSLQRMQWTRYGQLLLALRCISSRYSGTALRSLFSHIISDLLR